MTAFISPLGAGGRRYEIDSLLEGAAAHWDPELSTLTGTTLISGITSLTGGAARTLEQSDNGNQPSFSAAGISGKPALSFDGNSDHLFNDRPFAANLPACTVLSILQASPQDNSRIFAERESTNFDVLFAPLQSRNSGGPNRTSAFIKRDGGATDFVDSSGPLVFDGQPRLCGTIIDQTAGTITHFENDRIELPDRCNFGPMTVDRCAIGASTGIAISSVLNGLLGPVLVFPWALGAGELRLLTNYFAATRAYIPQPTAVITPPSVIPSGYSLKRRETFESYTSLDDMLQDGLAPDQGKPYDDGFRRFNVRHLPGNNDRAFKARAAETGTGTTPLSALGIEPHILTDHGTLILQMQEIPAANRVNFQSLEYAAGMISTEPSFFRQFGAWRVRTRIINLPPGAHYAVWLLTTSSPHELEIDMLEVIGNNTFTDDKPVNVRFYNGHDIQGNGTRNQPLTQDNVSNFDLTQWQDLVFVYEPAQFSWYVNGALVRQEAAYFNHNLPLYFLATIEANHNDVSENFPGPAVGNNPTLPAQVEIAEWEYWEAP